MNSSCPTKLRKTFDTAAERYDRLRPTYQSAVFEDLATLAELKPGSRILTDLIVARKQ